MFVGVVVVIIEKVHWHSDYIRCILNKEEDKGIRYENGTIKEVGNNFEENVGINMSEVVNFV